MVKKTLLRTVVLAAIQQMPAGTTIKLQNLYKSTKGFLTSGGSPSAPDYLKRVSDALRACSQRGDLPNEPRLNNDIRQAIRDASYAGMIKHVGTSRSGEWLRI